MGKKEEVLDDGDCKFFIDTGDGSVITECRPGKTAKMDVRTTALFRKIQKYLGKKE